VLFRSQRTLPYLKKWWEKYQSKGLIIVGIHTPEFDFEKNIENVQQAILDLDVIWPVVLDNEMVNWDNFVNQYWPAKYLIDKNGYIVYHHFGEGAYRETEKKIRELLGDTGAPVENLGLEEEPILGRVCFMPTPELYLGYERGMISNFEGYQLEEEHDYADSNLLSDDSVALEGKFIVRPQFIESKEKDATLYVKFRASEVNLVLAPSQKETSVEVFLNDKPVPDPLKGKDIKKDNLLKIEKSTMFNLIKSSSLVEGILKIKAKAGEFKAYAFTFSACVDRE